MSSGLDVGPWRKTPDAPDLHTFLCVYVGMYVGVASVTTLSWIMYKPDRRCQDHDEALTQVNEYHKRTHDSR